MAPWNLKVMGAAKKFSGVGFALVDHVKMLSVEHGYGGHIGLHSLNFYHNRQIRAVLIEGFAH